VSVRRYEAATGDPAVLVETGETFAFAILRGKAVYREIPA
jgi:hypothetical protein